MVETAKTVMTDSSGERWENSWLNREGKLKDLKGKFVDTHLEVEMAREQ